MANYVSMYSVKYQKAAYVTWQIFFQKMENISNFYEWISLENSEAYCNTRILLSVSLKPEKKRHEPSSLEADKQLKAILRSF